MTGGSTSTPSDRRSAKWFDSWSDLGRVVAVGATAYVALVVVLRLAGKRTLAKLYAFDLVVTVALGSTLATILLSADVSWAEGVTAFALLAAFQLAVFGRPAGPRAAARPSQPNRP